MRHLPWVIGTIATTVAGVVCGTTVNTTPLTRWDTPSLGEFASHQPEAISPDRYRAMQAQQDRYAMTTPDGVVPVEQLANRGLYSNARFANTWYDDGERSVVEDEAGPMWTGTREEPATEAVEPQSIPVDLAIAEAKPIDLGRRVQVALPRPVHSRRDGHRMIELSASLQSDQ